MPKPSRHEYRLNGFRPVKKAKPIGSSRCPEFRAKSVVDVYMYHRDLLEIDADRKLFTDEIRRQLKARLEKGHA